LQQCGASGGQSVDVWQIWYVLGHVGSQSMSARPKQHTPIPPQSSGPSHWMVSVGHDVPLMQVFEFIAGA
jgi:hypothetical protein